MFDTGGMFKKALITIKMLALAFAVWVIFIHQPTVEDDGANGLFIADTNWLKDIDDLREVAREHCAATGTAPTAFQEWRRFKEGYKNNSRRYYFSCR